MRLYVAQMFYSSLKESGPLVAEARRVFEVPGRF
jgi:hypothetical protein